MAGVPVERLEALVEEAKRQTRKPSEYVRQQLDELEDLTQRTSLRPSEWAEVARTIASLAETLAHLESRGH